MRRKRIICFAGTVINTSVFVVIVGFTIATALLSSSPANARGHFQAGGGFAVVFPQGDFKDHLDNEGYGFSGLISIEMPKSFLSIGSYFGIMIYGRETRREPFSTTIPDVTVEVETRNLLFTGHLLLRAQPTTGVVRPYVDGLFGLHYLMTDTSIESREQDVASDTNWDDATSSYGGGGGVMFIVYSREGAMRGERLDVSVDIGVHYLKGGEAEYLKEGSIQRQNGSVTYELEESETDILMSYIGVSVLF